MFNLPLNVMSNTTQRLLSQSNNIGYGARGVVRVNSTPDDRKADYLFRDFYMVMVSAFLTELGFRGLETGYTIPLMTKALDLHQLNKWYPDAQNYARLPEALRGHVLGSLVKSDSITHVPELMKRMQDGQKGKMTEAERRQAEILLDHLHRRLNFKDYLLNTKVAAGKLKNEDAELVLNGMKKLSDLQFGKKNLLDLFGNALSKPQAERLPAFKEGMTKWQELFKLAGPEEQASFGRLSEKMEGMIAGGPSGSHSQMKELSKELGELFERNAARQDANLGRLEAAMLKDHPLKAKLGGFMREGMASETTLNLLKRIQKSGTWPKMITSIGLTLLFYGGLGNYFDVKILQPWQERLVKERGTANEVVKPAYQALIPATAIMVGGMWNKIAPPFVKRMGYLGRFSAVAGTALAAYTGTTLLLVKRALSKPPKKKPKADTPKPVEQPMPPRADYPKPAAAPMPPGLSSPSMPPASPATPTLPNQALPFQPPAPASPGGLLPQPIARQAVPAASAMSPAFPRAPLPAGNSPLQPPLAMTAPLSTPR